jgi:two-component system, chemotaxis family, sensor kinase CheA
VSLGSAELYELFLALAPARVGAARAALELSGGERTREIESALIPFAVDAALLGADGLSALARAAAASPPSARDRIEQALDELERAAEALGQGDASGARVDESELLALAASLDAERSTGAGARPRSAVAPSVGTRAPERRSAATPAEVEDLAEARWEPQLADDMIAAFLDECVERTDALATRLLVLEERGSDPELVNELFRDLHTLKGSSAFAGLKKMNRVAHLAEDLIGELRDGKRTCDRQLIDLLLETLDVLKKILDRARSGAPIDIDVRDLLARLADPALAPRRAAVPEASSAEGGSMPDRAAAPAAVPQAGAQATLRIDFEKVDLLLNLVGEIVLARGKLTAAAELQAGLLREVAQLRKKFSNAVGASEGNGHSSSSARAPETAVRARASGITQLVDELQRTERVLRETYGDFDSGLGGLALAVGQLRDTVMKLRMVPIARLFTKYQRTVRELSHKLGKEVKVELIGAETELDKVLVERLEDPLLHLVRNAVDHGIELPDARVAAGKPRTGTVRLMASQRGGQIIVTIADDGAGMDPARLRAKAVDKGVLSPEEAAAMTESESFDLIFRAGFSTAAKLSDVSGRGVGMDVVKDAISKLKGSIGVSSTPGSGSSVELRLPLTLAITQVLTARVGGELLAVPLDAVVSAQTIQPTQLESVADGTCLRVGGELIPVIDLCDVLGLAREVAVGDASETAVVVIVEVGNERLGLLVQQVLGRHEVVIKSLGPLLASAPCAAGATLIGDRVLLVIDLVEVLGRARHPLKARVLATPGRTRAAARARVLVAEDSDVIRETIRRELGSAGFDVVVAADGAEALRIAREQQFDAVSTDVMMPRMDGYELTRALRADARYERVPIVMVTSKDARIDALRGHDAGADAYLTKPADAAELVRTLDGLLALRAKRT